MNTVLDVILVRASPIPNSFLVAVFFWGCVVITAASYVPRAARWLTDRDLEQIDDDELAEDLDFTRVDHGVITL